MKYDLQLKQEEKGINKKTEMQINENIKENKIAMNHRNDKNKSWYSIKCIFQHNAKAKGPRQMYDERIILLKATSFDDAIKKGEKDALKYAKDTGECKYAYYCDIYSLFEGKIKEFTEVFSAMRQSDLRKNI